MRKPDGARGRLDDASVSAGGPAPGRHAWTGFGLAFALMVVDFVDRQLVVAVFPDLRAEWRLSDTQLGALVSVVSVTVALGAIPSAVLVDRWSRVKAVVVMGTTWSLATLAGAFTQNFAQLVASRAVVGVGEAGYGPAAGALLATAFPPARRATVLGAFQAAAPLGTVLGLVLGTAIAANWGWRAVFGLLAVPGLVLAVAFVRVRDYPTVRTTRPGGPGPRFRSAAGELVRARSGKAAVAGGALQLMVVSTLYTWLPTHLDRSYGATPGAASGLTAAVILAGLVGTIGFAHVADRAAVRDPRARLRVPAALAVATAVLLATAFAVLDPGPGQIALVVAGGLTATAAVGPVAAVATDVVHAGLRATAIATVAVAQNLLGLAVGPLLTGVLADRYGLPTALAVVPAACGVAALAFWTGSRHYPADRDAVAPPAVGST